MMSVAYRILRATALLIMVLAGFSDQVWAQEKPVPTHALTEANSGFTFKGQTIDPGLIKTFQNWLSDYRPPITVSLDVGAAYGTNEYADRVEVDSDGRAFIDLPDGAGRFAYKHIGRLDNDIHVLHTWDKSDGTGIFQNLTFVRFHAWHGYGRDGLKPSERLVMSVVRIYPIAGMKMPVIQIEGKHVVVQSGSASVTLEFEGAAPGILGE